MRQIKGCVCKSEHDDGNPPPTGADPTDEPHRFIRRQQHLGRGGENARLQPRCGRLPEGTHWRPNVCECL